MPSLADFIAFHPSDSGGVPKVSLRKPFSKWPESLKAEFGADVQYILDLQDNQRDVSPTDQIFCVCEETARCLERARPKACPQCPKYCLGICSAATIEANGGEGLGYAAIGAILGVSKQRVQQIHAATNKKMRKRISVDAELVEFCANLGIGKASLPTPEELADSLE